VIENQRKKRENMEIKENLHKSPCKRSFTNRIHSLLSELMPQGALTSLPYTVYVSVTNIVSLLVRHYYWRQKTGHTQNI